MPIIQVELIEGRTVEQKRALAEQITEAVCNTLSVPEENVSIIFRDMPAHNLAKAGVLRCDEGK